MYLWTIKIPLNVRSHLQLDHEHPNSEKLQLRGTVYCLPLQTVTPLCRRRGWQQSKAIESMHFNIVTLQFGVAQTWTYRQYNGISYSYIICKL